MFSLINENKNNYLISTEPSIRWMIVEKKENKELEERTAEWQRRVDKNREQRLVFIYHFIEKCRYIKLNIE